MSCIHAGDVDAHFSRVIDAAGELRMRQHLPSCEPCTKRYERHLLVEALDPEAAGPKERLKRTLPWPMIIQQSTARRHKARFAAAVGVLAAAAIVLLAMRGRVPPDSEFRSRGAAITPSANVADRARLVVYRTHPKDPASLAVDGFERGDAVAFAYANPDAYPYLLVFAVDEHKHVFWYYPAWRSERENPSAIPIAHSDELVELTEAVSHPFDGKELRVYGLFIRTPLRVRDVEAVVQREPPMVPRLPIPDAAGQTSQAFRIR